MKSMVFAAVSLALISVGVYALKPVTASTPTSSPYSKTQAKIAAMSINNPEAFKLSGNAQSANFLAARISGLVCDLCVDGIEKKLGSVPSVTSVRAFPRDGVVFMSISQAPDPARIGSVLLSQGYSVHDLLLAKADMATAVKNPKKYAETLWTMGASEQAKLMSDPKNQQPTCEKKKEFASAYSSPFG